MCDNEAVNGVTRDGGYGEYVLLRTEAVVRVPRDVDPVEYVSGGALFFLFWC
jgi:D-arabinose 1-dehydrogenase-like Zn-dependent alcohol dehydrogenase